MDANTLKNMVIELDVDNIGAAVKQALTSGMTPMSVLAALTDGMDEVGRRYDQKEYYLTELVLAGETMKEAFKLLEPALKSGQKAKKQIPIVAATVKGDQHDIGKNILISLLLSGGFEIHDLGMDVPASRIVAKVKETDAKIVALSTLLTMTVEEIRNVCNALKDAGLRDKVKIIVGGAPLNMELAKQLGADEYADDATQGAKKIIQMAQSL
ncbi:MAG: methyltransferase cognate corrinoid protein [Promethearchaeota archaeon CR_4]|nr:MAG: methyltransferase cognate corrinoid protein [Candidatus Lokiarchaeota archaeon CR_4]